MKKLLIIGGLCAVIFSLFTFINSCSKLDRVYMSASRSAKPNIPQCPPGQHWDYKYGRCVPNDPACAVGFHWDPNAGGCVKDCPLGYHQNQNGICVDANGFTEEQNHILNQIFASADYQSFLNNHTGQTWGLDRGKSVFEINNGLDFVTIPTIGQSSSNPSVPIGYYRVVRGLDSVNNYYIEGIVYDLSQGTFNNQGSLSGGFISITTADKLQIGGVLVTSEGRVILGDIPIQNYSVKPLVMSPRVYYYCVRNEYNSSKNACSRDPNCNFVCDWIGKVCKSLWLEQAVFTCLRQSGLYPTH